jgi:PleD family two-component response regulator
LASFGVATYHRGDSRTTFVKRADVALYRAKERGKNRVEAETSLD